MTPIPLGEMLENVRGSAPLIHSITNYVTANDCANILLACGASPIMADDAEEVEEITGLCAALNINIGTLNRRTIPSMLLAGKRANALGRPAVLDPVGAGASRLRTETARRLLGEIRFTVIRGNGSEITALARGGAATRGVDAGEADQLTASNLEDVTALAKAFSRETGAVIAVTGAADLITDGERAARVTNGHPMMRRVTGTGCMLSAVTAAFLAANPGRPFEAAVAAVAAMGLCGETAAARLGPRDGSAALRNFLIDAMVRLTPAELERGAKVDL